MSLSSLQLDAFVAVSQNRTFSAAATALAITQSALSQRVLNLEQELGATLFLREPAGVRLTDLGQRLLRFCQSKGTLEQEFMTSLRGSERGLLGGVVRVAGFSTIASSVLVPTLAELVKSHPDVQVELMSRELRDLPALLVHGEADFIFLTHPFDKQGVESQLVGYEENVLIRPQRKTVREEIMLDHDVEDSTALDFFKTQGKKVPKYTRSYLDDIHAIIEGVRNGLGSAVVPMHLVADKKGLVVVEGYRPLKVPVYFVHYTQAFYSRLHQLVIEGLPRGVAERLN